MPELVNMYLPLKHMYWLSFYSVIIRVLIMKIDYYVAVTYWRPPGALGMYLKYESTSKSAWENEIKR